MQSTLDCVTVPKVKFPRLRVPWLAAEQEASEVAGICRRETRLSGKIRKFLVKFQHGEVQQRHPANPDEETGRQRKLKSCRGMNVGLSFAARNVITAIFGAG